MSSLAVATAFGGVIFNGTTVAIPKLFEGRSRLIYALGLSEDVDRDVVRAGEVGRRLAALLDVPLIHTGRPWLAWYWLLPLPNDNGIWVNFRSPLLWDVFAVGTYTTVSLLFWVLGLVPDFATFRDKDGVWAKYDYRQVATPEGFAANPALVHDFYNQRRRALKNVMPNAAHAALAELEAGLKGAGGRLTLITQNVDGLHQRAGSRSALEFHGNILRNRCFTENCRLEESEMAPGTPPSCRRCGSQVRPDVVWFGEMPRFMEEAADAIMGADLFVSIGTSGSVYPAAGFVAEARALGVAATELNLEPSENAHLFSDARYGPATEVVPGWVREILRQA